MACFRGIVVCFLISGLIGCQSQRAETVTEYRPATPIVVERKAPDSEVFQLVRWQPIAPLTAPTSQPSKPLKQMPVEVEQVYALRGSPIGFRRHDGQLLAVAGATSKPLSDAHYAWRTVPGSTDRDENARRNWNAFGFAVEVVIVATVVVVMVGLVLHENRHTLLRDLFNSFNSD
jgi:hypothetical protein